MMKSLVPRSIMTPPSPSVSKKVTSDLISGLLKSASSSIKTATSMQKRSIHGPSATTAPASAFLPTSKASSASRTRSNNSSSRFPKLPFDNLMKSMLDNQRIEWQSLRHYSATPISDQIESEENAANGFKHASKQSPTGDYHMNTINNPAKATSTSKSPKKSTILTIQKKYQEKKKLTMVTAYDFPAAALVDKAQFDMVLVGDSLAMVVLGHPNTCSVTMDEMLHHARAVSRGSQYCFKLADMPFGAYEVSNEEAVRNAMRFMKEANMDGVKLEGGKRMADRVRAIVQAGIPVCGHIGLTPQTISSLGGFRAQGKTAAAAAKLYEDALALQEAGCFALVIESVPDKVAAYITENIRIPTIGIGAGPGTSGQVLVLHDMLGLYSGHVPKFCKQYVDLGSMVLKALEQYRDEVTNSAFPEQQHCTPIVDKEYEAFINLVARQHMLYHDQQQQQQQRHRGLLCSGRR
eukprot:GEZU01018111.1.p1 GENE.GEZU01018111.1~~GEZU01018111.1.p1  ORF type:complete len:464 (+),score=99.31 GEZU01018111.1:143-1534(+)